MAQPPGTARYFPYDDDPMFTTEGYATASFSPSMVGQVYWFGMTVAFSGSDKFGVWNPYTDTGDELDIQFLNSGTHYVSESVTTGSWDLYTPDSVYPVLNVRFEVQNPGFQEYNISFSGPDTWVVYETFSGISVSGVDCILKALPAGLGYSIPVYVLCFCSSKAVPSGESDLELSCGRVTLYSTGAGPMMMAMSQMSVEEASSVVASARESEWFRRNVTRILELSRNQV